MNRAFVLDAGALIALDRNNRHVWSTLEAAEAAGDTVQVPAGVIVQAWRDGSRQARLSLAIRRCDVIPLDLQMARRAGLLCGATDTSDVVDASVALVAADLAQTNKVKVITSDSRDINHLTLSLDVRVEFIEV